jgi:hypothetical protein
VVESKEVTLGAEMKVCTVRKEWNRIGAPGEHRKAWGQDRRESRQHGDRQILYAGFRYYTVHAKTAPPLRKADPQGWATRREIVLGFVEKRTDGHKPESLAVRGLASKEIGDNRFGLRWPRDFEAN